MRHKDVDYVIGDKVTIIHKSFNNETSDKHDGPFFIIQAHLYVTINISTLGELCYTLSRSCNILY